jgi:predicted transcriptional regulator
MSTTTIRLTEDLRVRLKDAAQRAGTTPHNFILEAIAEKTEQAERRSNFDETADQRFAKIAATGMTVSWNEMRTYLEGRAKGGKPKKPVARKLAR